MADLGTRVRLSRLCGHPSGYVFVVAIDHIVGYPDIFRDGLGNLPRSTAGILGARPDAMSMSAGTARSCWSAKVGKSSLIVQAGYFPLDDRVSEFQAKETLRLVAESIAVAIGGRGPTEGRYLRMLADTVRAVKPIGLLVIIQLYPGDCSDGSVRITITREDWPGSALLCRVPCRHHQDSLFWRPGLVCSDYRPLFTAGRNCPRTEDADASRCSGGRRRRDRGRCALGQNGSTCAHRSGRLGASCAFSSAVPAKADDHVASLFVRLGHLSCRLT